MTATRESKIDHRLGTQRIKLMADRLIDRAFDALIILGIFSGKVLVALVGF